MAEIQIAWNLSRAWRRAARDRRIRFEFALDAAIDSVGRSGDSIVCGIEPAAVGDRCQYFARNETTGSKIPNPVIEKTIPGTDFIVQFNRGRSWRPGASVRQPGRQPEISGAWQDCRFDCQVSSGPNSRNSLLLRDPLAQIELAHWRWNAYHNLVPFEAEGHFLWIPIRQQGLRATMPHYRQYLTREFLADFLHLGTVSSNMLFFFNSLHAGASVNHIHFQSVAYTQTFPLERAIATSKRIHYSPASLLKDYPARALIFPGDIGIDDIFPYIDRLQRSEPPIPFNLLLLGDWVGIFPRNLDNEILPEMAGGAISAMEMAGKFITSNLATYNFLANADLKTLAALYAQACLPQSQLEAWLGLSASP